ncbi:DRTGG domain-containing protein [Marinitoga lauensis]|uniref:DRTGG domain-containing protein n=1 Tax=Marinitoga lauensis TaxID=2201189 RepID=UPI001010570F|nr:DRTGG domain-containing protein [Marinitoga lauensis]
MKLSNLVKELNARILHKAKSLENIEIEYAGASDLMSDFLAFSKPNMLLITGLATPQTLTTASVIEASAILFVRGKTIPKNFLEIIEECEIPILTTDFSMYYTCAKLYQYGIKDAMETDKENRYDT